jgi:hAT family C-terminal dimerisation region
VNTLLTASDSIRYVANITRRTLKAACKELGRFTEASKKLAVENQETLHLVIPILYELKVKMLKQEVQYKNESPEISQLCRDLAKSVDEKCWSKLTWYHFAAAYLHPAYRELDSLKLNSTQNEIDRVRLDLKGMLTVMEDRIMEAPAKKKLKTVLFCDSDDESGPETEDIQDCATAADEINIYSTTDFDCEDGNDVPMLPLAYWKSHRTRFPKLAVIARSVYSIPASQNKTERAFSAAGHVMTDLRTTLDPEHLDELLLIRSVQKRKQSKD